MNRFVVLGFGLVVVVEVVAFVMVDHRFVACAFGRSRPQWCCSRAVG